MAVLGPFHMREHKSGDYIRLARNPNYWKIQSGRRLPYLDSIRVDIQPNRDIEFLRFQRGELHLLSFLDPDQFQELARTRPEQAKDAGASLENEFLWFNMAPSAPLPAYEKAWFQSRNFRVAVSHAIRRDDLCRVVYQRARGFRHRSIPGRQPVLVQPATQAARIRSAACPPPAGGRRIPAPRRSAAGSRRSSVEFSLITNAGNKARERMASMIQQDLAALGSASAS